MLIHSWLRRELEKGQQGGGQDGLAPSSLAWDARPPQPGAWASYCFAKIFIFYFLAQAGAVGGFPERCVCRSTLFPPGRRRRRRRRLPRQRRVPRPGFGAHPNRTSGLSGGGATAARRVHPIRPGREAVGGPLPSPGPPRLWELQATLGDTDGGRGQKSQASLTLEVFLILQRGLGTPAPGAGCGLRGPLGPSSFARTVRVVRNAARAGRQKGAQCARPPQGLRVEGGRLGEPRRIRARGLRGGGRTRAGWGARRAGRGRALRREWAAHEHARARRPRPGRSGPGGGPPIAPAGSGGAQRVLAGRCVRSPPARVRRSGSRPRRGTGSRCPLPSFPLG